MSFLVAQYSLQYKPPLLFLSGIEQYFSGSVEDFLGLGVYWGYF